MLKPKLSTISVVTVVALLTLGCAQKEMEVSYVPVPVQNGYGETVKVYNGRGENIPVWMTGAETTTAQTTENRPLETTTRVKTVKVIETPTNPVLATSAPVQFFFEEGVARLNNRQRAELDSLGESMRLNSEAIAIEGYADPKGQNSANYTLGLRRANGVKDYLESKGISNDRIRVTSFGESRDPERKVVLKTLTASGVAE